MIGIDEAGRGSALGPLVVAGCAVAEGRMARLAGLGLADSKALSPAQRRALDPEIRGVAERIILHSIPPRQIDLAVARGGLNGAEISAMLDIIRQAWPCRVFVDALTSRPKKFGMQLESLLAPLRVEIVAENHADAKYPVVQAASIIAKVSRDAEIDRLKERWGETGSGYPGDPATKAFLAGFAKTGDWPECVRRSWKTIARFEEKAI